MGGLVLVMVGEGKGDVGQPVERQLAIGLRVVDRFEILGEAGFAKADIEKLIEAGVVTKTRRA